MGAVQCRPHFKNFVQGNRAAAAKAEADHWTDKQLHRFSKFTLWIVFSRSGSEIMRIAQLKMFLDTTPPTFPASPLHLVLIPPSRT